MSLDTEFLVGRRTSFVRTVTGTPALLEGHYPLLLWSDAVVRQTVDLVPEPVGVLLGVLSHLGSVWFVVPAIVAAFLLVRTERATAWLGVIGGGYGVMIVTKSLFAIERPAVDPPVSPDSLHPLVRLVYEPSVEIATTTFPSGHALIATVLWGLFVLDSTRFTRTGRIAIAAVAMTLAGITRVALGVHYPIDVVAGVAVGAVYLGAIIAVLDRVQQPAFVALGIGAGSAWIGAVQTGELNAVLLCGCLFGALLAWLLLENTARVRLLRTGTVVSMLLALVGLVVGWLAALISVTGVLLGAIVIAGALWPTRKSIGTRSPSASTD